MPIKKKAAPKKVSKRVLLEKPYCSGTMTNSGFWGFIRSALRQKSRWWKPITDCKIAARRLNKSNNKRLKYEYQCNTCRNWFPEKEIVVDHIVPAGTLTCYEDLPSFVKGLFCELEHLQVQCDDCHTVKTNVERAGRKKPIKKKKDDSI
jgi:5-methylcytosine-specific restriction endonuclease McrA